MIDFSRYGGHRGGRDLDTFEGGDIEDFYDQIEAYEDDEFTGDIEDGGEALDAWREAQEEDGGDELECGLSRNQLRVAAKVLFSGLSEVFDDILRVSRKRLSRDGTVGSRNGAVVSAAMVAGIAVALSLPRYERSANVARSLRVTRAGVSLYAAKFGRMLGTTSEQSARKQVGGILSMARVKAGMGPKNEQVIHRTSVEELREKPETREWLESLPEQEREEARKALRGKVA
jgi:hypothetical protein